VLRRTGQSTHIYRLNMLAWFVCSTPVEEVKKLTLITAIKTPYLEDGRFDLPAFDRLTNLQIQNGVEGIIVGGTTGEGQLMNWTDHIMLIGHACVCFGDKIKVIGKHSCKCVPYLFPLTCALFVNLVKNCMRLPSFLTSNVEPCTS